MRIAGISARIGSIAGTTVAGATGSRIAVTAVRTFAISGKTGGICAKTCVIGARIDEIAGAESEGYEL